MNFEWKVVPLSEGQLTDVNPEDILEGGLYRRCDTYRGGGGYDKFPYICEQRIGKRLNRQFVVQLYGCNLDCPYCYVTREGVWGTPTRVTTDELIKAYNRSGLQVFHLMGGAPALHLRYWSEIINRLDSSSVFHSDFMLSEQLYDTYCLKQVMQPNCLYAVNIKGTNEAEWMRNTRKPWDKVLFWENLKRLMPYKDNWYFTFTNIKDPQKFEDMLALRGYPAVKLMNSSFNIELIDYKAMPYVDSIPWGGR